MKCLQNVNHPFDVSIGETGFTVRKGRKWYDKCILGEKIELWECDRKHAGPCSNNHCKYSGKAEVVLVTLERLKNISSEMLLFHHSKKCRDYESLKKVLLSAYGEFDDNEVVTLLFYKRLTKGTSCLKKLSELLKSIFKLNLLSRILLEEKRPELSLRLKMKAKD